MNRSSTIQARIKPELKKEAQEVLDKLNLTMSEAITLFLTQVKLHQGIPFAIKIPNEETENALLLADKKENLYEVRDSKELFEDLDK